MTREEAIANLGTIARSGTAEFFRSLSGDEQKASPLIGQFGVGFYSAFIVAERVEVRSRKAGSRRGGGRALGVRRRRGVHRRDHRRRPRAAPRVTLHLKADAQEFADPFRLRGLIRRYSDHIGFPVRMRKEGEASLEYEVVNQAKALWTLPRTEIKDEEYQRVLPVPRARLHRPARLEPQPVEGKREYTSLLYMPGRAPFDLWQRDAARGTEAVRAARVHHGRRRAVPAAVPALRQGRGRLERPAAERLARAAAAGAGGRGDPQRPHQARARPARRGSPRTSRRSTPPSGRSSARC